MSLKRLAFASMVLAALAVWSLPKSASVADEPPAAGNGEEVLTQGPVHEAFAAPTTAIAATPLIVPKQPPALIEELPPDVKPDGNNVTWISGYWAWDDTRKDYLWVSGIWRDTPPGFIWVPGYWTQVTDGFEWTAGFWSPAAQQQVSYLPKPPDSIEAGPNVPAPHVDDVWIPGNFEYVEARSNYGWRPGYWAVPRPDLIWTPASYVWTPSGYIFIPGHWDYALERRGVLFAPVYFSGAVYARPGYVFGPSVVIDSSLLTVNFFVRPGYHHYYFGDYYDNRFVTLGFSPWFSVGVTRGNLTIGGDPLFAYYRWSHRDNPVWFNEQRERFTYLSAHPEARPARTFVEQSRIAGPNHLAIGAPLNVYVKNVNTVNVKNGGGMKFVSVSQPQREQLAREAVKSQDITMQRAKLEASPAIRGGAAGSIGGRTVVGAAPKTLDLHSMAQSTGGQLPGGTPGAAGAGAERRSGTFNPAAGTGASGSAAIGGQPKSGPTFDPRSRATGPTTSPGTESGPVLGPGSGTPPTGSPGRSTDSGKGRTPPPSGSSGPPSSGPSDSGRGRQPPSKDPGSGKGKNPDSSKNPDDSRGGRLLYQPGDSRGSADSSKAATAADEPAPRAKDPIRPLTLNPGVSAPNRAAGGSAAAREAAPEKTKDPIKPLTLVPSQPNRPGPATTGRTPPRDDSQPRAKDPIQPLRLVPPNGSQPQSSHHDPRDPRSNAKPGAVLS